MRKKRITNFKIKGPVKQRWTAVLLVTPKILIWMTTVGFDTSSAFNGHVMRGGRLGGVHSIKEVLDRVNRGLVRSGGSFGFQNPQTGLGN